MLERQRRDLKREGHFEVVTRDEHVDLARGAPQLGLDAAVEVDRGTGSVKDPFGGQVAEQRRPILEPLPMRA